MLVQEWMTREVISISPDTSVLKASKLMKDHDVRRLPVVDSKKRVIGIVSDRDIKEATPSKATTLDMHELSYILTQLKVEEIMTVKPKIVHPLETVEHVALLMEHNNFGGVPVVDDEGVLIGIITDHDIFKVFINITGARMSGLQLAFQLPQSPGTLRPILDALRERNGSVISILTATEEGEDNMRKVYIRIRPLPESAEDKIVADLKEMFPMLYWARDTVHAV